MSDCSSSSPERDRSVTSSDSGLYFSYQAITESEFQKACASSRDFEQGNYERCLKTLKALQLSRPQDTKVLHNVAVAEYYHSRGMNVVPLFSNLLSVCAMANIDVSDIDALDDVDQCVVFYNRALILYHLQKYRGAICILDKIFQFVEPLDETLGRKICLLLLELYLSTHQPKKALGLIGYMESLTMSSNKSNKSPEKDQPKETSLTEEMKLRLTQSKARCYAMMKTVKPCKREVKSLMVSGYQAQQIAAFFIKSQLEYQRGNYRKAIKILNSPDWPADYGRYFMETGDCLQAVFYNNLGCIHYYMGKPSLGAFYVQNGFKRLNKEIGKVRNSKTSFQPLHAMSISLKMKLVFNMGMQHFQREKYHEAFKCFVEVCESYSDNPRLWLRIAECCIQFHVRNVKQTNEHRTVKSIIGSGKKRKVILNTTYEPPPPRKTTDSSKGLTLSLSTAVCALRNALLLLPKEVPLEEMAATASSQSSEEKDADPLEENCVPAPPCSAIPMFEIQNLRNSVLVALAYSCLRLGDFILCHEYATQLLSQPKILDSHKFLGHMYAGEALVYLDNISDAVEHFNPKLFCDLSLVLPEESVQKHHHQIKADTPDRSDSSDCSCRLKPSWNIDCVAMSVAQYNLSVVYALRGEWLKALRLALEVSKDDKCPPQTEALMVYIHLCQGATDVALSILNRSREIKI